MKSLFAIGEVLWIKTHGKLHPIKILDISTDTYSEITYTFCSARDDAKKREDGGKYSYFEKESELKKMVL